MNKVLIFFPFKWSSEISLPLLKYLLNLKVLTFGRFLQIYSRICLEFLDIAQNSSIIIEVGFINGLLSSKIAWCNLRKNIVLQNLRADFCKSFTIKHNYKKPGDSFLLLNIDLDTT